MGWNLLDKIKDRRNLRRLEWFEEVGTQMAEKDERQLARVIKRARQAKNAQQRRPFLNTAINLVNKIVAENAEIRQALVLAGHVAE